MPPALSLESSKSSGRAELTESEYFRSFNENYGEIKKALPAHMNDKFWSVAIYCFNYVYRFTDALFQFLGKVEYTLNIDKKLLHSATDLYPASGKLLKIRSEATYDGVDFKTLPENEKEPYALRYAKPFDSLDAMLALSDLINMGVNIAVRDAGRGATA